MISCKLQGGLGNQMFQISTATALALRNNDMSCFNFNQCHTPLQGNPSNLYKESIFKNICNRPFFIHDKIYNEPKFSFSEIPYSKNLLLNGYFQSEKYFSDFKDEIINMFSLSNDVTLPTNNLTSVHIRRGDYLKLQPYHSICDINYYKNSMNIIGGNFLFFSDDIEWVKNNFKGSNIFYSENNDEVLDLSLMSLCDNNIIANSSFSWWGAFLNKNKDKKVISPSSWFGDTGPKDTQDITPQNWLKL
jgi:hypothetical protein